MDCLELGERKSCLHTRLVLINAQTRLVCVAPNIRELNLMNWSGLEPPGTQIFDFRPWKSLKVLSFAYCWFRTLPILPVSLVHLELTQMYDLNNIGDEDINLPNLESFYCGQTSKFLQDESSIYKIIKDSIKSGTLRTLEMSGLLGQMDLSEMLPFERYDGLETLIIERYATKKEKDYLELIRKFPRLKRINLAHTNTTGITIRELADRGKGLVSGVVQGDEDSEPTSTRPDIIMSTHHLQLDAIEYARNHGIKVILTGENIKRCHDNFQVRDQLMRSDFMMGGDGDRTRL